MTIKRVLPILSAATLAAADAVSVNYNFYNSAGTPAAEDPAQLVGPAGGSGETWNQGNGTSGSGLLDTAGAATTVGFTIPTSNRWNWGTPALKMLHGGAAQFSKGDNTTFTLTGLTPGAKYDIWLASYAHNTTLGERALGEWSTSNKTATFGPQMIDCRGGLNGTTWEKGRNYVLFEAVEADPAGKVVFLGDACDVGDYGSAEATRLPLNGFQLAPALQREPLAITDFEVAPADGQITLTWKSNPGETYGLYWSADLVDFAHNIDPAIPAAEPGNRTTRGPFPNPLPGSERLFFQLGPPDLADPTLEQTYGNATSITLVFSEPMHAATATDPANYAVTRDGGGPVTLDAASLSADGKTVTLTTAAPLELASSFTVTVNHLKDRAGRPLGNATVATFQTWDNNPDGVQVFILAGQSNMVGHGKREQGVGDVPGAIGGLRYMVVNDTAKYGHLLVDPGQPATSGWVVRNDVKVWWRYNDLAEARAVAKGNLNVGFAEGRNPDWFGPEYAFGWVLGDHFADKPVLLIKTAWGGKSLHVDFRPPSAVAARGGVVGPYYTGMIDYVRDCLGKLGTEFPEFAGIGYRIAGVGWHQGWNDRIDATYSANYEANLVDLIHDLRAEFGRPDLPVVIGTTGMDPPAAYTTVELAQLAVADPAKHPELAGTVSTVDARPFWRDSSVSPSAFGYHWNHNGESHFLLGDAMGKGIVGLLAP